MASTTVSDSFEIVIPEAVREQLGIRPGQEVRVVVKGNIAQIVPCQTPDEAPETTGEGVRPSLSQRILERRNGEPLPDSTPFIRAERERLSRGAEQ